MLPSGAKGAGEGDLRTSGFSRGDGGTRAGWGPVRGDGVSSRHWGRAAAACLPVLVPPRDSPRGPPAAAALRLCLEPAGPPGLQIRGTVVYPPGPTAGPGPAAIGPPGGPRVGRASVRGPRGSAGPRGRAVPSQPAPRRRCGVAAVPRGMEGASQVPNSPRLHLRLRHERGLCQSDGPRGAGARPGGGALLVAGGHGGVGAAGWPAGAARGRPSRPRRLLGLAHTAPAAPSAALVPTLPPPGGHRDAGRAGRRRAVQRRVPHGAGPAPPLADPSGRPPRLPRLPGPRPLARAGVPGRRGGGGAGRAGPGGGHPGGRLQPHARLAGQTRPAAAGLRPPEPQVPRVQPATAPEAGQGRGRRSHASL